MRNNFKYFIYFFTLISIFLFSCEDEFSADNIEIQKSKIWIDGVVGTDDTIKLFLGTTSGLNSKDIAEYKDNALINLFVNSDNIPIKLKYKKDLHYKSGGFYYYPRLANAFPGDTISFTGWIPGSKFDTVSAETLIPNPVNLNDVKCTNTNDYIKNVSKVSLEVGLDTSKITEVNRYLELYLTDYKYENDILSTPSSIIIIDVQNDLDLSDGLSWNSSKSSILIDRNLIKNNRFSVNFIISKKSGKDKIELKLKTISSDYYKYSKALDNSSLDISNINNGYGIFSGYSKVTKSILLK